MVSELRKSTNAILFERVTSPFFGTLMTSWLIWNWKIIYLTFFVSESEIKGTKIDFIGSNYSDINLLVTFPLLSTVVLLTIIPFVSNGAFWLSLKFKKWRTDQKNEIEKKQLLTLEQSVALRSEVRGKELEFEKVIEKKALEEKLLKTEIEELRERLSSIEPELSRKQRKDSISNSGGSYSPEDFLNFKKNKKAFEPFKKNAIALREKNQFPEDTSEDIKEYYLINDIVEAYEAFGGETEYKLSFKGGNYYRDLFNEIFNETSE